MAASLITRTGNLSALEKLKPIQPLPKCFGFLVIRPLRTGTGKPMDALSNFQPRTFSLNLATNCFGPIRGPEGNSRSSRGDISNFTCVPPISTTRIFLFMSGPPPRMPRVKITGGAAWIGQDAGKSSVVLVLPQRWHASIPLFRERETGTAVAAQISNRAADSWQFVALTGRH